MKKTILWFIFLAVLGVSEIAVIGQLHALFGLAKLIGLYVLTTSIGVIFLVIQLPEFRKSILTMRSIEKGFLMDIKKSGFEPSAEQIEKLRPMMFFMLYVPAAVLIAIPGIVSDIIGIILVVPFVSNYLLNLKMNKAKLRARQQS